MTPNQPGNYYLEHIAYDKAGNQYVLNAQWVTFPYTMYQSQSVDSEVLFLTVFMGGRRYKYRVSFDGRLMEPATAKSYDGMVTLEIPMFCKVLNADGTPTYTNDDPDLIAIECADLTCPGAPVPPAGYSVVNAYQFTPAGTSFSIDTNMVIEYDPEKLPAGSAPTIAFFNDQTGQWDFMETAGYVAASGEEVANTLVTRTNHFTYFAVLAETNEAAEASSVRPNGSYPDYSASLPQPTDIIPQGGDA